uniref:Zinc finger protein 512B n=1 Tax=Molossus molossus TaxID=27622 RepID=A0A7J8HMR3_MOLMO|nr:zinc finger protein 512B [Molossus molossus]
MPLAHTCPALHVHTGLAKAEDKSRGYRAKKQEGPSPEDVRKKVPAPASTVSKEGPAPVAHPAPGGPEEQWQRAIHERGEAVCPTCNVVTRKTLVGLKKHMEVCQKVRLPPGFQGGGAPGSFSWSPCLQLQDALKCRHCRKQFKSKAGLNYHTMAEHSTKPSDTEASEGSEQEERERLRKVLKQMGRLRCPQELNYTRPGLPTLNPQLLEAWKNEVKEKGHVNCPNDCCEAIYSSVSGLKAHLASCSKGDHLVGKYCCLLCPKEFSSESGVKYHILKAHAEVGGTAQCERRGPGSAGPWRDWAREGWVMFE